MIIPQTTDFVTPERGILMPGSRPDFARAAAEIVERSAPAHDAALIYARAGVPVFPCGRDKRPMCAHGFKDASTDQARITRFWNAHPGANIGVPTGQASGVIVIDIDTHGTNGWTAYNETLREVMPVTLWARTGGGGCHLFLRYPDGQDVRNSASVIGPGIDVRARGGYVLVAPSETRATYTFQNAGATVAEMPGALITLCQARPKGRSREMPSHSLADIPDTRLGAWFTAIVRGECDAVMSEPEGTRRKRLLCAAGRCGQVALACGLPINTAAQALFEAGRQAEQTEREALEAINTGFEYAEEKGPAKPPRERERR